MEQKKFYITSAAREAEIDFIYAEYGFGEVEPSLYVGVIDSFKGYDAGGDGKQIRRDDTGCKQMGE